MSPYCDFVYLCYYQAGLAASPCRAFRLPLRATFMTFPPGHFFCHETTPVADAICRVSGELLDVSYGLLPLVVISCSEVEKRFPHRHSHK